jgi:2,4-dienoyl-CoA reductase-like NADH-dependent reductase (Old Yellow Enzyme family)
MNQAARYPTLLSPISIGPMTCRNRIVQTAHSKLFIERGVETRRNRDYQRERARGGVGLMITGNHLVHPTSPSRHFAAAYVDGALSANRKITAAVHEEGGRIICQLNHLGVNETPAMDDLTPYWGPSSVRAHTTGEIGKAMELGDIQELITSWGDCAAACRDAGFDGVELHMGHGWLLHEFLSPIWNQRTDDYGGSFENRLRLPLETLGEVRRRVGDDFVVGARISLTDGVDGGLEVGDAVHVAKGLTRSGGIDYATMTAGGVQAPSLYGSPSDLPRGHLLDLIARFKADTNLPVIAVGGINEPQDAERLLADGVADMVAMTREQIADPEFIEKVSKGREDELYHCIRANQGCIGRVGRGLPIGCTVNPAAGREARFGAGTQVPAATPERWVVVGGGPAGMKAAVGLAERGHEVVLSEASDSLGGQVNLILKTPGRQSLAWLTLDLERHLERLDVRVELGRPMSAGRVEDLEPDAIVVATGAKPSRTGFTIARPLVPALPGIDRHHVVTGWEVLNESMETGQKVVLLEDDGTRYAAGVAEVLLDRGSEVELVTPLSTLFPATAYTNDMAVLYRRLMGKGLHYTLGAWATDIGERDVGIVHLYADQEHRIDADTVVLVGPRLPNDDLYLQLVRDRRRVHRVGDCVAPRSLDHAIYEGFLAGRELWSTADRHIQDGELEQWEPDENTDELAVEAAPNGA